MVICLEESGKCKESIAYKRRGSGQVMVNKLCRSVFQQKS